MDPKGCPLISFILVFKLIQGLLVGCPVLAKMASYFWGGHALLQIKNFDCHKAKERYCVLKEHTHRVLWQMLALLNQMRASASIRSSKISCILI